jgi:hypothetical protein
MATEQLERREEIVQEMLSRLKTAFPHHEIVRGTLGAETEDFPSIFLFEDVERFQRSATHRRGMYLRTLPLIIDYLFKASSKEHEMKEANQKMLDVVKAIEQDDFFRTSKSKILCVNYSMVEADIIPYHDDVVDVNIVYNMEYKDNFMGV